MAQTSLSYYEKVLKSKVARVRLYPAQDAGAFGCQGAEDRNLLRLHRSCGPAAEKFTIGVVFMNILFFLSPKQDLMYVYDDFTLLAPQLDSCRFHFCLCRADIGLRRA